MRILVTNDDGIDSIGLHLLAQRMTAIGDVVVVAPDCEYSGAGAAIGALHMKLPEAHEAEVDGVTDAWAVTGPPALCIFVAGLGVFGDFDLVVAGINPGANVGRSVYHSGTVGACLTARLRGITGIAISQKIDNWGIEGQTWDQTIANQKWHAAADVAQTVVRAVVASPPPEAQVLNVNIPNLEVEDMAGWRHTTLAPNPPRSFTSAHLEAKPGHLGTHHIRFGWGESHERPADTDAGAVARGEVSLGWLNSFVTTDAPSGSAVPVALDNLIG